MIPPSGAREDRVDGLPKEAASAEQPPSPASTSSQESKVPRALAPGEHKLTLLLSLSLSTFVSFQLAWRRSQRCVPSSPTVQGLFLP